ncbi:MAG: cytochrome c biogenesis CcdA family protein [Deltaproteobacteria bacterium]|nr:cytochrome c biogenesis CcdA family protein [Deltaproteobacteria bacterium]MDZ4342770.1 cytochrome c biogenesis CcdA family protein [Candidatus Binatia bacterium]
MADVNILVAFTAGIFSFLSPCVLPMIPSYLSFISGVSLEEMRAAHFASHIRRRVLLNSLAFILGFSLVFISLGASASFLSGFFLSYRSLIRVLGGIFILAVGIYLLGVVKFSALDRYLQFHLKNKPGGYLGSALVGITFGAAWIPCVGPILGAILTLAATSSEIGRGVFYLATYAAGLALPFFLSAVAVNSFFQFSQKFRRYVRAVHVTAGIFLIIVGLLLITDYMTLLNIYAIRFTPGWLIKRL